MAATAKLSLDEIRSELIRQEETIIFALIERAQFKQNLSVYKPGSYEKLSCSFLEFFLGEVERVHSATRRYTSPDEHPFFPEKLVDPVLPLLNYPRKIQPNKVNLNQKIMSIYISKILPAICEEGDDQQHGSSVNADVAALQAISKRIHYGKFVAEAKFSQNQAEYSKLIEANDGEGLLKLLTNEAVESRLLKRVTLKAATYGRDIDDEPSTRLDRYKVAPALVEAMYRDYLMPLTKEVQVLYLLQRLKSPSAAYLGPPGTFSHAAALAYFGETAQLEASATIPDVFAAVLSNRTLYGIVPFENNTAGKVHATVEQIVYSDARVIGELFLPVSHNLLCKSSSNRSKIRRVCSHAQALDQCKEYLRTHYPGIEVSAVASTARAAELAAEDETVAAIASAHAAERLGLQVLARDVQDNKRNSTRFFAISKQISSLGASGRDSTLLVVRVKDQVGALARVVGAFAAQSLNLSTIESFLDHRSATESSGWDYSFLIQVEAHPSDPKLTAALKDLEKHTNSVKIAGGFCDKSIKWSNSSGDFSHRL